MTNTADTYESLAILAGFDDLVTTALHASLPCFDALCPAEVACNAMVEVMTRTLYSVEYINTAIVEFNIIDGFYLVFNIRVKVFDSSNWVNRQIQIGTEYE
jgi:hypothetical protein